jgi:hypothetical protein
MCGFVCVCVCMCLCVTMCVFLSLAAGMEWGKLGGSFEWVCVRPGVGRRRGQVMVGWGQVMGGGIAGLSSICSLDRCLHGEI